MKKNVFTLLAGAALLCACLPVGTEGNNYQRHADRN